MNTQINKLLHFLLVLLDDITGTRLFRKFRVYFNSPIHTTSSATHSAMLQLMHVNTSIDSQIVEVTVASILSIKKTLETKFEINQKGILNMHIWHDCIHGRSNLQGVCLCHTIEEIQSCACWDMSVRLQQKWEILHVQQYIQHTSITKRGNPLLCHTSLNDFWGSGHLPQTKSNPVDTSFKWLKKLIGRWLFLQW